MAVENLQVLENPAIVEAELKDINGTEKEDDMANKTDSTNKRMLSYWIDMKMIISKVSYILYYASCGAWWPYTVSYTHLTLPTICSV